MSPVSNLQLTLRDTVSGKSRNFVLSAEPDTPMPKIVAALETVFPGPIYSGERKLDTRGRLADSGISDGSILTAGAATSFPFSRYNIELAITGGPAAGMRCSLRNGVTTVGSSPDADITIDDKLLPPIAFRVMVANDIVHIDSRGPRGVHIDGEPVAGRNHLYLDQPARVGATVFEIREPSDPNADVRIDEEGNHVFNRPGRIQPARPSYAFKVPVKPSEPPKARFPWLQAIIPLVLSAAVAYLFHNAAFLLLAVMSPVMAVGTTMTQKRDNRLKLKADTERFERVTKELTKSLDDAAWAQSSEARSREPDAATTESIATFPMRRLWERRPGDSDFLAVRVGTTARVIEATLENSYGNDKFELPKMYNVPVGVSFEKYGVVGVAGPNMNTIRSVGRWLVGQLAAFHSPNDLKLFIFADSAAGQDWSWTRWLPHTSLDADMYGGPYRAISSEQYTREAHVKILLSILADRKQQHRSSESVGPAIVVVYDGIRAMRNTNGVAKLLKEGPEVGIYALGLDDESSRLAQETRAEVVISNSSRGTANLKRDGEPEIPDVNREEVSVEWAEQIARALAPIIEAGVSDADNALPSSVRFVDLMNVDLDSPEDVLNRWTVTGGRTTEFVVGSSFDGPFALDLKLDGPHGLVAGTTGAGKSEFLQTVITSLALVNRPDSLNFLLIDYKGASAFAGCAHLPHVVGMVTNLDGHLTMRALTALDAELHRRERILNSMQSSDVDIAWQRDPQRAAAEGLARLVIVIDEFAELSQELPDFITGLIRVARVGRSLGVHLLLGTQRPSGVVSAEMRANTGLRIALRVEDKHDSTEVIDDPDASTISRNTPGRAYARLGGGGGLVPFQTARVAGRRRGLNPKAAEPKIIPLKWSQLGRPLPLSRESDVTEHDTTDLHALVGLINKATQLAGLANPPSPIRPPLPEVFTLKPVEPEAPGDATFAMEDQPTEQAQPLVAYDIETAGHMIIAGSARSGRTTALRTLAGTIANTWSPSDCHIYGLDFGNGGLLPLASLPHCGAVVGRGENDRAERLIRRIVVEIGARQEYLAQHGFGDISEQRSADYVDDRFPYIVVLLDRWEGLVTEFPADGGSPMLDHLLQISREGPAVGVRLLITGDRSILIDRFSTTIEDKFLMRLNNADDFTIAGIPRKEVPESLPAGRAIHATSHLHRQFALLYGEADARSQAKAIEKIAEVARQRWVDPEGIQVPMRVDVLPSSVSLQDALALGAGDAAHSRLTALVGVGGDTLGAIYLDMLDDAQYFMIVGPSRSGRSTSATVMASTILGSGGAVVAVAPRRSPLEQFAHTAGVPVFKGRADEADALVEVINGIEGEVTFIIDDCGAMAGNPFDDVIRLAVKEHPQLVTVVVVGSMEEMKGQLFGTVTEARKSKAGLLFSPQYTMDGDIVGMRIPRNMIGRMAPGRGLFCLHGQLTLVQVPTVE